jgi:hypothetical protein
MNLHYFSYIEQRESEWEREIEIESEKEWEKSEWVSELGELPLFISPILSSFHFATCFFFPHHFYPFFYISSFQRKKFFGHPKVESWRFERIDFITKFQIIRIISYEFPGVNNSNCKFDIFKNWQFCFVKIS